MKKRCGKGLLLIILHLSILFSVNQLSTSYTIKPLYCSPFKTTSPRLTHEEKRYKTITSGCHYDKNFIVYNGNGIRQPKIGNIAHIRMRLNANESSETVNELPPAGKREEDDPFAKNSKRVISATVSTYLPFSTELAFDAFSDLRRQPSWSPWLRSVKYVDNDKGNDSMDIIERSTQNNKSLPLRETEWTIRVKGVSFRWRAISTLLERPNKIHWESISGIRNRGAVQFLETENGEKCQMTLKMSFIMPRILVRLFRKSNLIKKFFEETMLGGMLKEFEQVVVEEDLNNLEK